MKREIKFRVWHKPSGRIYDIHTLHWNGKGEVIGGYLHTELNEEIAFKIEDVKLMQYTGLKDKNGKEIFEEDIIENEFGRKIVKWGDGGFYYCEEEGNIMRIYMWLLTFDKIEVIGNFYENPELL